MRWTHKIAAATAVLREILRSAAHDGSVESGRRRVPHLNALIGKLDGHDISGSCPTSPPDNAILRASRKAAIPTDC